MPRSKHRPGRKAHRPHTTRMRCQSHDATPLEIATFQASKLSDDEQQAVLTNPRRAFAEFRAGRGSLGLWMHLADAINTGLQLTKGPAGIACNHGATFEAAVLAMRDVHTRAATRRSWTLRAAEMEALDMALCVHAVQLQLCSRGELAHAYTTVANVARAALSGSAGPGVQICGDLPPIQAAPAGRQLEHHA